MGTKEAGIFELSVAERIQMVDDIWDGIAAVPGPFHSEKNKKGAGLPAVGISPEP